MEKRYPLLILLYLLLASPVSAQLIISNFTPPDDMSPELVVCGNQATFSIQLGAANLSNLNLDLDMTFGGMTGIEYVPGTFSPALSEGGSATNPTFELGALSGNQVYTFDAVIDCDIIDFLNGGGLALFEFSFTYNDDNNGGTPGSTTWTNSMANGSQEFNNSIKYPITTATGLTNFSYVASNIGETFSRTIRTEQSGLISELDELILQITYGSGIAVSNQAINGVPVPPADFNLVSSTPTTDTYEITISNFSTYRSSINGIGNLDNDDLFESPTTNAADNEFFIWSEDVEVLSCDDDRETSWLLSWGCGGENCHDQSNDPVFGVAISTQAANINVSSVSRTFPDCVEDAALHTYTVTAAGPGTATNVYFRIRAERETWTAVDASSLTFNLNGSPIPHDLSQITNTVNLPGGNCHSGTANYYDRFDTDTLPALEPGDVLTITFETYQCCTEDCGDNPSYFGSNVQARYTLPCGTSILTDASGFNDLNFRTNGASTAPAAMALNDTETFAYNLISFDGDIFEVHNKGEYCIDVSIPANMQYQAGGTVEWVSSDNNETVLPTSISPAGTVNGPATITACFGDGFANAARFRNSFVNLDLTYYNCACGSNVTTEGELYFRYEGPTCADPCSFPMVCESDITHLIAGPCCGGGGCDGTLNTGYSVERTCYGEPDNDRDGCPDAGGALNLGLIRTDRAMKGDELRFTATGLVNLPGAGITNFDYMYFETSFNLLGERVLLPTGNNVLTIRTAGGNTYTCTDIASINDSLIIQWDLSALAIQGCGDVPPTFTYTDGDTLTLEGDFVYTDNIGCDIANVYFENTFYGALSAAPVAPGDRYTCTPGIAGGFEAVGYEIDESNQSRSFTGCGYRNGLRSTFCLGGDDDGSDPFPYEFRNFSYITEAKIAMPEGYLFDRATYTMRRTNRGSVGESFNTTSSDFVQLVNDTFVSDFLSVYADCGVSPGIPFSDDGNYQQSDFFFDVPCTAELNVAKEAYHEVTRVLQFCSPLLEPEYYTSGSTHTFTPTGPELNLTTALSLAEPIGKVGTWDVILDNLGNGALNTFLVIINPNTLQPIGLEFDGGGAVPESGGVYQLGNISSGSSLSFDLNFNFESCGLDSLLVVAGYDCLDYPADRLEVLSGGWPCELDSLWLYSRPIPGELKQDLIMSPNTVVACDQFIYEIQLTNVKRAIIYEPEISVFMPYSSGIDIIMGTEEACFPCDPTAPTYNYPIFEPTRIIATTLGIEYIWDLDDLIPPIAADGMQGLDESDTDLRTLRLQFTAETNCNFTGSDFPRFTSIGQVGCQGELTTAIQPGSILEIMGTGTNYAGSVDLEITAPQVGNVNACGGIGTLSSSVGFAADTDGQDTILIVMPLGTTYVPGSVFFSDPSQVTSTTPVTQFVNGLQEVMFNARAGIPAFTNIDFVLDFQTDPDVIPCRFLEQPFLGRTFVPNPVNCDGVVCEIRVLSGSTEENATFEKFGYEISGYNINVPCGGNEIQIENMTVTNVGAHLIDIPTTVEIYHDADGSGDTSALDILLGTLTSSAPINPGASINLSGTFPALPGQTCSLIAFFTSCSCTEAVPLENINYINAGDDITICNNENLDLGCGEMGTGFSYFWSGLNGSPASAISDRMVANPSFSYTNTNTSPDTLQYVLATTFGSCQSFDTVEVVVLPTTTNVGATQRICPGETLMLAGPIGQSDYSWLPTTDLSSTTSPQPILLSGNNVPTTYTLSYTNADGCEELYEETVLPGFNCTDLELTKTVDLSDAIVGDVLTFTVTVVNQGALPASGVQVTDKLPSNLQYLTHAPITDSYDDATGVWDIGVLPVGDTLTLTIEATVLEVGLVYNCAEITAMDNTDSDSTPGNGDLTEDDKGYTCTTIPTIVACDNEVPELIAPGPPPYQWYFDGSPIGGATDATFTPSYPTLPACIGNHRYSINPDGSCGYDLEIIDCSVDLSLQKTVSAGSARVGDMVTFTLEVSNAGPAEATNVEVADLLPAGLAFDSYVSSEGTYDSGTGVWSLPIVALNDSESLQITASVVQGGLFIENIAEVTASDQPDIDSEPGNDNGDQSEDDEANATLVSIDVADIGNYVWHDIDQDGRQDAGESPIENVTVTLYNANTNGIVTTDVTDSNGEYLFTDIPAGDYYLVFDITSNTTFMDYVATVQDNWADVEDSDILGNGRTANFAFNPANGDNLTLDAGFHLECGPPSISVSGGQ